MSEDQKVEPFVDGRRDYMVDVPGGVEFRTEYESPADELRHLKRIFSHVTRTCTLVLQAVLEPDAMFVTLEADALQEYVDDLRAGRCGGSCFERHIQKNGVRIDVIASVPPYPEAVARESIVDGDADRALLERLMKLRTAARFLPGQPNAGIAGAMYTPELAAKDMAEWINETLAALGIGPEEAQAEPTDEAEDVGS
jgi:hypothetical protein